MKFFGVCCLALLSCSLIVDATSNPCPTLTQTVYAGQHIVAGTAYIYVDSSNVLHINVDGYDGWEIGAYHIYIGTTPPPTSAPGQFPYKKTYSTTQSSFQFTLSLASSTFKCGDNIDVAIHMEMSKSGCGYDGSSGHETGWAFGNVQFGPWGWYNTLTICCPGSTPSTTGVQTTGVHTTGVQTTGVQTTGVQTTGVQTTGVQTTGVQTTGVQTTGVQTTGVQTTGVQTTGVQTTGVQTTGVQTTGVQTTGVQTTGTTGTTGVQTTGVQTTGVQTTGVQTTGTTGTTGSPYIPPPPPVYTDCDHKGKIFGSVPSLFNVFVFEDFVCNNSDTEGRLAAGGNINIDHYQVGCLIYPPQVGTCLEFGSINCTYAVARGDWVSSIVAGGDIVGYNMQVQFGNVACGGTYNHDVTAHFQDDCTLFNATAIDFSEWEAYLTALSTNLAKIPATGAVTLQYGGLTLTGTQNPEVEVFSVNGADLCSTSTTSVTLQNVNSAATIIINVNGNALQCGGYEMTIANPELVLFNFYEATTMTFYNVNWEGSVLAVYADMVNNTGRLSGQLFAKSWVSIGECMQQNWVPFEGCIPDACLNIDPRPYCTVLQNDWSGSCGAKRAFDIAAEEPGCVLDTHFYECFGLGGVTVGCPGNGDGFFLTLDRAASVQSFLPQSVANNLQALDQSYLNPITTPAGAAAGELVTLALSLQFDKCAADSLGLCSTFSELYMCPPAQTACDLVQNHTIGEIFHIAQQVIGGCQTTTQYSVDMIYNCLVAVNQAFSGCDIVPHESSFAYCPCGVSECARTPYSLRSSVTPITSSATTTVASFCLFAVMIIALVF